MAIRWLNIAELGLSGVPPASGSADAGASQRSDASRWRRVARSWVAGAALVALCLAVYLPGLWSIPAVDRDEARFAQASRQMFEAAAFPSAAPDRVVPAFHGGGWVVPRIQDRERLNKPPLIYWLQVASAWLFTAGQPLDDAIWMYRIPSVLAAIFTVLITWRLGCSMLDPRAAWLAAALLAVAPMIVWDAHQARSDSVMMAFTTGATWALWACWSRGARDGSRSPLGPCLLFWLCLSLGIMTKGFVTPMVVCLAAFFLAWSTRSWRWLFSLRPLLGIIIIALPLGAWLYFLAQHKGGLGPYARLVWDEFFVRGALGSKEGHFWPPGFHTVLLAALFWPGSLMTLAGFARAWKRARGSPPEESPERELGAGPDVAGSSAPQESPERKLGARPRSPGALSRFALSLRSGLSNPWRGRPAELFLIAWIVPAWIVFELSPAKLPHYTMPMLPAVALLSARMVMAHGHNIMSRPAAGVWIAIFAIPCAVILLMGGFGAAHLVGSPQHPEFAAAVASVLCATVALWLMRIADLSLWSGRVLRAQLLGIATAAVVFGALLNFAAPLVVPGAASRNLAAAIATGGPASNRDLASTFRADSIIWSTRGRVQYINESEITDWFTQHPAGLAIIPHTGLMSYESRGLRVLSLYIGLNTSGGGNELALVELADD